ncbi:sensor histidine kinase [Streptomyces sp. NPDC006711]|uniref:sensor histidine kinase n=1 Tax=Streptomyces sp. NPDC006711 TaxID=3364762 RepID=UPI003691291A
MGTGQRARGQGSESAGRLVSGGARAALRTVCRDLLGSERPVRGRGPASAGQGWLAWRPAILMPLLLVAVSAMAGAAKEYTEDFQLDTWAGTVAAVVQAGAMVTALYRPLASWRATTIVTVVAGLWAGSQAGPDALYPWNAAGIAMTAEVLLLVSLTHRPRIAAEALVVSFGAGLLCAAVPGERHTSVGVGVAAVCFTVAAVLGAALRGLGVARTQLVAQEELTAEERARRTLLEERGRIARELHDVVAHHMSVISIQAQVAPHLVEDPSDELKENLAGIRQNAVEALTELRRVLGVLRSDGPTGPDGSTGSGGPTGSGGNGSRVPGAVRGARHAPQPSLDRIDELVANVRGAGLTVTSTVLGTRRTLAPGVELSAFRIVQEALSNAMRHAPGATVAVLIAYHRTELALRVTNTAPDRPVAPSPGAGHGLLGMRERTAMLGGELAVGATPDGGYEVSATLPLDASPS